MKKVLFFNGSARLPRRWGLQGEVLKRLQEDPENDVYVLACDNCVKAFCWCSNNIRSDICKKCKFMTEEVAKLSGISPEKYLKMKKVSSPKFPNFRSIQEALIHHQDGYELGLGPITSIMTATRDYDFDIKKTNKYIKKHMHTVYTVIKNLEELHKQYHFDEFHIYNGRFTINYGCISFAKKHKIPYFIYDGGANLNKFELVNNDFIHNFYRRKEDIKQAWINGPNNKEEIAIKWYTDRRNRKFQFCQSFVTQQEYGQLPPNFDLKKENITFFNSSIDEIHAFESWRHPLAETENVVINTILQHYANDDSKHFYLRIHPNLTKAKRNNTKQIREINEFKKKFKNLTILEPDDEIDSYALIEASDKIITSYSTIGCEAAYYGKPVILAGKSIYEDLDCVYKVKTYDELFEAIDNKKLTPKNPKNTYPLGFYYETFGFDTKYYISSSLHSGKFLSKPLVYEKDYLLYFKNFIKSEFLVLKNLLF